MWPGNESRAVLFIVYISEKMLVRLFFPFGPGQGVLWKVSMGSRYAV